MIGRVMHAEQRECQRKLALVNGARAVDVELLEEGNDVARVGGERMLQPCSD